MVAQGPGGKSVAVEIQREQLHASAFQGASCRAFFGRHKAPFSIFLTPDLSLSHNPWPYQVVSLRCLTRPNWSANYKNFFIEHSRKTL